MKTDKLKHRDRECVPRTSIIGFGKFLSSYIIVYPQYNVLYGNFG